MGYNIQIIKKGFLGIRPKNPFSIFAILVFIVSAITVLNTERTHKRSIQYDLAGYFSYLPAIFLEDDLSFHFTDKYNLDNKQFLASTSDTTLRVNRYSIGTAVLLSPFYAFKNKTLPTTSKLEKGGFSNIYLYEVIRATIIYVCLGFLFLRGILLYYFDDITTTLSILGIGLGTNLFYYSCVDALMSHACSFFLFSVLFWSTFQWLEKKNKKALPLLGITMGLIACVRLPNLIVGLLPLLWGIKSLACISERASLLWKQKWWISAALFCFLIGYFPQILYYKLATGHWWVNAYQGYSFWWEQPLFWRLMLSFRNGWLIYSPIMLLGLAGIYFTWKYYKEAFWPLFLFLIINIYVLSSWWCWWYIGFGMRAMVEALALMAFPFCVCISILIKRKFLRWFFALFFSACIYLNLFQTHQYIYAIMPWDGMNKETYFHIFGKTNPVDKEFILTRDSLINYNLDIHKAINDKNYRWEHLK